MRWLDTIGNRLQSILIGLEVRADASPLVAVAMGAGVALSVIAGGIITFIATFVFLVEVLH